MPMTVFVYIINMDCLYRYSPRLETGKSTDVRFCVASSLTILRMCSGKTTTHLLLPIQNVCIREPVCVGIAVAICEL